MKVERGKEPDWYKKKCKEISCGDKDMYNSFLRLRLPDGSLPTSFEGMFIVDETAYSMDDDDDDE